MAIIIAEDRILNRSWNRALQLSVSMLEDTGVPPGTRYDALRMVAMLDWTQSRPLLEKYLSDSNAELQMGAVSGLSDVAEPESPALLIQLWDKLTPGNRRLAGAALLRTDERCVLALKAIEEKRIQLPKDDELLKALQERQSRLLQKQR